MSFTQTFIASGPLFEPNPDQKMRKAINEVLKDAAKTQISIYKGLTPVRTGKLQQGWKERAIAGSTPSIELYNDVLYAPFVFKRINLLGRTEGQLSDRIEARMYDKIDEIFN
jgi:hypothetical protein